MFLLQLIIVAIWFILHFFIKTFFLCTIFVKGQRTCTEENPKNTNLGFIHTQYLTLLHKSVHIGKEWRSKTVHVRWICITYDGVLKKENNSYVMHLHFVISYQNVITMYSYFYGCHQISCGLHIIQSRVNLISKNIKVWRG